MKNINWKIRFQNPVFIFSLILSFVSPMLVYLGLRFEDLTSWGAVFNVLKDGFMNPYCLGLSLVCCYNAIVDPTTKGVKDDKEIIEQKNLKK